MSRPWCAAAVCGLLVLAAAGCNGPSRKKDFEFDGSGWGGADLEHRSSPSTGTFQIESGLLLNRDFRWADSEFSFDFFDTPDLKWNLVLLDSVFLSARRKDLRDTWIKTAPKKFELGKDLGPAQLWVFDRVAEMGFRRDQKGTTYKVLDAWWYPRIRDEGRQADVRLKLVYDVRVRRSSWNTFRAKVAGGRLTYWVNGEAGKDPITIDARANGRLGIFVQKGVPLRLRNFRLSAGAP